MRIDIVKQLDTETREVWSFNMFDLTAVFVSWNKEVKPKGKRKWTVEKRWDKYRGRESNVNQEPILPEKIREDVLLELTKYIKVKTWSEWKT
jgi:hypothetical protein